MKPAYLAMGAIVSLLAASADATEYRCDAASGLLPSAVSPPFTLVDSASPENPVLDGGVLTPSGNLVAETMYCIVTAAPKRPCTRRSAPVEQRCPFPSAADQARRKQQRCRPKRRTLRQPGAASTWRSACR